MGDEMVVNNFTRNNTKPHNKTTDETDRYAQVFTVTGKSNSYLQLLQCGVVEQI